MRLNAKKSQFTLSLIDSANYSIVRSESRPAMTAEREARSIVIDEHVRPSSRFQSKEWSNKSSTLSKQFFRRKFSEKEITSIQTSYVALVNIGYLDKQFIASLPFVCPIHYDRLIVSQLECL